MDENMNDSEFLSSEMKIMNDSEEREMFNEDIPETLGILPLKNTVLYPGVVIPITVGRQKSIQLVQAANKTSDKIIGVIAQRNVEIEEPEPKDLYRFGVMAKILRLLRMPDGTITVLIQGRSRFEVQEFEQTEPYFVARLAKLLEEFPSKRDTHTLLHSLKREAQEIIDLSPSIPPEAQAILKNVKSLSFLIYFIATNLNLEVNDKQVLLEMNSLADKGQKVLEYLGQELAILELSEEINSKVRLDLDRQQKEYFLRQQIKAIHEELGDSGPEGEVDRLRHRALEKDWPMKVQEVFEKEVNKLSRLTPHMPDYAIVLNYVEWLLDLPWGNYKEENFDIKGAKDILDNDHYGLEKVKDRILEYLAVLKLKADKKAPILCFYGPPGVGKTSLGKSIARSLEREFIRISLGGVRDEAEIRGHRRTYIGAMPGRIIQGLKKAKTGNPVFMLDEIDKVGSDHRGDPSSALLEVLDPEQNDTFQDHFLEVEYDLSRVMFVCTANTLGTIHPALLDRMEIIEINGYSQEEKIEIAERHLIPRIRKEHGLKASQMRLQKRSLKRIIEGYTRESGVRNLAQKISGICRSVAKQIVMGEAESVSVSPDTLEEMLGLPRFENEVYQKIDGPGVAIGLAWTSVGGDILFIETSLSHGSGRLVMTGQLGDVMKESATLAYSYLKTKAHLYGIKNELFKHWDVHIHFPAGAVPKDGPSAGIAILSAMTSAFTQRKLVQKLAMTGEITLRGKVLPVGGIKSKVLAAKRAGIKTVVLCKSNKKDIHEIKDEYIEGLKVIYVDRMEEVLEHVLEKSKVPGALDLMAPVKEAEEREKKRLNPRIDNTGAGTYVH